MCRIDPTQGVERAARGLVGRRTNAMDVPEAECALRLRGCSSRKMDPSVLQRLRRKALMSRRKDWTPISLTNSANRRIFDATFRVQGHRMRSNPKPAVGDMRKRITRRCVSAATGACC